MSCWDTSGLLKLYFEEADSLTFRSFAARGGSIIISGIARYEAEAAFRRKELDGTLRAGDADVFQRTLEAHLEAGRLRAVPLGSSIDRRFSEVLKKCLASKPSVFIRTSDALHIATALAEGEMEFVTADHRQRTAAAEMGLNVWP